MMNEQNRLLLMSLYNFEVREKTICKPYRLSVFNRAILPVMRFTRKPYCFLGLQGAAGSVTTLLMQNSSQQH